MKSLSSRMQAVQSPIIPIIGQLIRSCPGTISLGQGVVYYGPPPEAMALLPQFLSNQANHQYQPVQGIAPLLEAIKAKLQSFNHIKLNGQNCIVVTAGSNMAFMNAILAITSVGDEIILQTPYYFNHEMAIRVAGCRPVLVPTDENYQPCPGAIAKAITEKTKAVVTVSPNNPTGSVYSESALREINQICHEHGIYHISDEAYEYFTYNDVKHTSPGAFSQSSSHTISLYSLSKAYGFASWRIGYMVIPEHLMVPIKKVQDTILICPPVVSQFAALGALQAGIDYCQTHIRVVLQKFVEDRKLPEKGISYATTPKISAMNFTRSLTAPLSTSFTCPFRSMFMSSYPFIVRLAVLNEPNLIPGLTNLLINRWSCSIRLLRYLFCRVVSQRSFSNEQSVTFTLL